uniref:Uncharacterized protein n=1 Tax=Balaenoptera musculus TaxID=9771 RepID=A0A8C0E5U8_BALMU
MVAEAPSGGTDRPRRGACGRHRAAAQTTRAHHPSSTEGRFVRGPRPPNQQQAADGAETKERQPHWRGTQQQGDERVPPPRFRPRYRRPFHPRPTPAAHHRRGDGETKSSQGRTDGSRPEPQRPRNRPYFQRDAAAPWTGQPIAPETSAPINSGGPPTAIPE